MRSKSVAVTTAVGMLLVTGCAASPGTYYGVEELKDAYVRAGGECHDWDQHNAGIRSEESGSCGDHAVLSYYGDNTDGYDTDYAEKQRLNAPMIIGDNWIIQTRISDFGAAHKLANDMGGKYDKGEYRW